MRSKGGEPSPSDILLLSTLVIASLATAAYAWGSDNEYGNFTPSLNDELPLIDGMYLSRKHSICHEI